MPKKLLFLLAPKHAGQKSHLSPSRLAQLAQQGELEVIRDSLGRRLYLAEEIERFVQKREREAQRRERHSHSSDEPRTTA